MSDIVLVLKDIRAWLARPGNDFSGTHWKDAQAALSELDALTQAAQVGYAPAVATLRTLLGPTGPVQQISARSGWGESFQLLSERFNRAVKSFR